MTTRESNSTQSRTRKDNKKNTIKYDKKVFSDDSVILKSRKSKREKREETTENHWEQRKNIEKLKREEDNALGPKRNSLRNIWIFGAEKFVVGKKADRRVFREDLVKKRLKKKWNLGRDPEIWS